MALLDVENLTVEFYTERGVVTAVDGLSYRIDCGERLGVVGESGAGKSVAALAVLGLIDAPGRITSGAVRFDGTDLLSCSDEHLRSVRGAEIGMVFQDAGDALNPVYTVGDQLIETITYHEDISAESARNRALSILADVGIDDPTARYEQYPHQLSGGLKQRVAIALALACDPSLLIADEPTTALDVTTEAGIIDLLSDLAADRDIALQFVTHDLGVVASLCDRVVVMYAGQCVERAPVDSLYYDPKHPYTAGLLSSIPRVGVDRDRLQTIPGAHPDMIDTPSGCRFHPRCPYAEDCCARQAPPLVDPSTGKWAGADTDHAAACLAYTGELDGELTYEIEVADDG